jgi:hypothetical protein
MDIPLMFISLVFAWESPSRPLTAIAPTKERSGTKMFRVVVSLGIRGSRKRRTAFLKGADKGPLV